MSKGEVSKRRRFWQTKAKQVDRMLAGATAGPVRWVNCRSCGEALAEIRYERDDAIAFEVMAPLHDDAGVTVLERSARADAALTVVRETGDGVTFRCPSCNRDTPVNLTLLRAVRSGLDNHN